MKKIHIILTSFLFAMPLIAQTVYTDRVVARVGDEVITLSELDELYNNYKNLYPGIGETELKNSILQELINSKILLNAAKKDTSIQRPTPQEIEQALEYRIAMLEQQYGKENLDSLLKNEGLTRENLKEMYKSNIQEEILIQKYIDKYVKPKIQVTPQEIRKFYDSYRDSLKEPDLFRLSHIFIMVKTDTTRDAAALKRAQSYYNQIKKGANFEEMANRYSDDRESASYGGAIGTINRNFFPPEIQSKLDQLNPGEISEPIRGDYGYHIFKMVNKGRDSYELKHILVKVEASPEEWNKAYQKAISIKNKIEVQKQDFETLARQYSDDEDTKGLGGDLGWIPFNNLPEEFKEKIKNAKVGDILILKDQSGYHVVKVVDKKEGKTPEFTEIQNQIKQYIENLKLQEELQKTLNELRNKTFIEIKEF